MGIKPIIYRIAFVIAIVTLSAPAFGATMSIGSPSVARTKAGPVTYTVTYTGATAVTLSTSDITLNTTGDATGSVAVTGSGTGSRTVTISSITGTGTLGITIATNTATVTPTNGATSTTFIVDNTAPTVSNVVAKTYRTIEVTFDESMLAAGGVTTANNYTLSGAGMGSLASHPNSVALVSGSTYRLTWTANEMLSGGDINVAVATATDLVGNAVSSNYTQVGGGIGQAPTVTTVAVQTTLTVDVTFSETMAAGGGVLTASNYTISGTGQGTLAANPNSVALVSGNRYRLTWSSGEMKIGGNVTITVANATDSVGNPAASSGTHTSGGVGARPTVSSIAAQTSTTIDITFNEAMGSDALTATYYTLSGTGIGSLASNPSSVSFVTTSKLRLAWDSGDMLQGGNLTVTVTSGTAPDLAGNAVTTTNSASQTGGGIGVPPTVSSISAVNTNEIDITFSEAIGSAGVTTATNYTLTGTGIGTLASQPDSVSLISGSTYALVWSSGEMFGSGNVTVTVTASAISDVAGNVMTAGNSASGGAYGIVPTVSSVNVVSGLIVDVTFSEAMLETGIPNATMASCYTISGIGSGSLDSTNPATVTSMGSNVYRLTWSSGEMILGEDVTITVTGVKDLASNPIPATGSSYYGTDVGGGVGVQPTVTAVSVVAGGQIGATIDITFSEAMDNSTTLVASNYVLSGTGLGALSANPNSVADQGSNVYRLTWTSGEMKNAGDITITVVDANVKDVAGNVTAALSNSETDAGGAIGELPTVTITSTTTVPPGSTNVDPIPVTVTFSESVTGFTSGDVSLSNASLTNFSGSGTTYTFDLVPSGVTVVVTADIAADSAVDGAGNGNTVATQFTRNFNSRIPTVALVEVVTDLIVDVTFNEAMLETGTPNATTPSCYSISGAGSGSLLASNPATVTSMGGYRYRLTWSTGEMVQGGDVTITVTGVQDVASNPIPTTGTEYIGTDVGGGIGYQPTITSAAVVSGGQTGAEINVTFSEAMNNVGAMIASNYAVSGSGRGTLSSNPSSVTALGGNVYRLSWATGEMKNGGNITITATAANVKDLAGNTTSLSGNSATHTLGAIGALPSVTISSTTTAPPGYTNVNPIPVTVTFSEAVTGFTSADVVKSNATLSNFTGSGDTYTFGLVPTSTSTAVTVDIAAGAAQDDAGNLSTVASQFSRNFDSLAPTVTTLAVASNRSLLVTFSKTMSSSVLTAANFTLSGTGKGSLGDNPNTVDAVGGVPSTQALLTWDSGEMYGAGTVTITAANVTDSTSGNLIGTPNSASCSAVADAPVVTIGSPTPSTTNSGPVTYPITYTDDSGIGSITLTAANVTLTTTGGVTGTVAVANADGASTVTVNNITGNGTFSISIAAGVVSDRQGNLSALTTSADTVTVDNNVPTLSVGAPSSASTTGADVYYDVTYSGADTITLSDADITVNKIGTALATPTVTTVDSTTRRVTLSGITGSGILSISIAANSATDTAGNPTAASGPSTVFSVLNWSPIISSATVHNSRSVDVTFNKAMGTGVTLVENYVVSGTGLGNLTSTPTSVTLVSGSTYRLAWSAGEMFNGGDITVLARDMFDAGGQALDTGDNATITTAVKSDTEIYVSYREPVGTGATTAANYTLSGNDQGTLAANPTTVVQQGSTSTYLLTWSSGAMTNGGASISLAVENVLDARGLALTAANNTVTHAAGAVGVGPTIAIGYPSRSSTNSGPISYTVSYADATSGVGSVSLAADDITLNKTGTADATVSVSAGATSTVTLSDVTGDGSIGISIAADTALDGAGNPSSSAGPSTIFTVDNSGPPVAIGAPSASSSTGDAITYTVTYTDAASIVLTSSMVILDTLGSATGDVAVSGTGLTTRTVTISNITGIGAIGISLSADTAYDTVGTGSSAAGPSSKFTVVNDTAVVQDAEVQAGGQTINVTFSKPMNDSEATNPLNYVISGAGIGNLTTTPDSVIVSGANTYQLIWNAGEMVQSSDVMVTVSNVTDSTGRALDTSDNQLITKSIDSDTQLYVSFRHAMGASALVATNYTISGNDQGTLAANPDSVTRIADTSTYLLIWSTGAMTNRGAALDVAVSNILDARGQELDVPNNSFNQVGGGLGFRPTATISAPSATATNTGPVTFTVNYADVGSGLASVPLTADMVTLTKTGTADATIGVANEAAFSTVTVENVTGEGTLAISLAEGACRDSAGNTSAAQGPSATFVVDNTAPSIAFGSPSDTWTTAGPVTFTVTYTDTNSGIQAINLADDMVVLNMTGTARGDVSVSGAGLVSRTVTVSNITGNGTLSLYIDEGSAVDYAGNSAAASGISSTAFSVDNHGPDISIGSPSSSYWKNGQPAITYLVTYSDVAGVNAITLASGDISLHRTGTADATTITISDPGIANTRRVSLSGMSGDGDLSFSIASNTATDLTGNSSGASDESEVLHVDNTKVGVSIGSPSVNATRTGPVTFTVTYTGASAITLASGARSGNTFGDITLVRNGTADATGISVSGSGTSSRTVAITGTSGGGTLGITIVGDTATDAAGNGADAPTASALFTVDNVAPTVSSITPQANGRSIDVTFDESMGLAVTTAANYAVSGTGAGNLPTNPTSVALVSGSTYRLTWTSGEMLNGDPITVTVSNAQDLAGNAIGTPNSASGTAIGIAPTLTIGAPSATSTRNGPITFPLTYNDVTSGVSSISLTSSNITINKTGTANCTWSVSGSGLSQRTVTLANISGDGALGISVAASTALDAAGNAVLAAGPSATVVVDRTDPDTPVIGAPSVTDTRTGPVSFVVTYADAGSGISAITLNPADVTLDATGDVAGTVTVTGTGVATRTVTVDHITGNGAFSISLAAHTAVDSMGNYAPAAGPSTSVNVDENAPAITISSPSHALVKGNSAHTVVYGITYTDQTTITLVDSNITLNRTGTANGSVAVSGSGAVRTVTISSLTGDGTLGISIAANTASDAAGNMTAAAGPSDTFTVDSTCTMSIGAPAVTDTSSGPVSYTITYTGANSVNLSPSLISLNPSGSATGSVSVTGVGTATRTVTISDIVGDGAIGFTIVGGTAEDDAGNLANGATSATFNVDNTAPTLLDDPLGVVVYGGESGVVKAEVDVTFSEAMDSAGVTDPTNYSVSGTGAGSLPTHPYNVALVSGNKYRLTWLDGQMIQGKNITISVNTTNVRDRIGNALGTPNSGTHTGGGIGGSPETTISAPSLLMSSGDDVSYRVWYSSPGGIGSISLTTDDITLSKTGTAYATLSIEGTDDDNRVVVLSNITGVGTLRIWVAANTATDNWGNSLPAAGPSTRFSVDTTVAKSDIVLYVNGDSAATNPDGSLESPFSTITSAVAATDYNSGYTILVQSGVYSENVNLKSGTKLIGESGVNETFLFGVSTVVPVLTLAQGCEVDGFTISAAGAGVGALVPEGASSVITNCVLRGAAIGVLVEPQALLAFQNNTVFGNSEYGVLAQPDATLEPFKNNIIASNGVGLSAEGATVASNGYNSYYDNETDVEGTELATTDFLANPSFVDENGDSLTLSEDSPCLHAGEGRVNVGANVPVVEEENTEEK